MDSTFALVVDDSKSARFAMRRFLENGGQEVDTAESGLDALEKIRQRRPDILFLDHVMPVLDGFAVLEMLRRDESMASIPVVLCTSNESADFAQLARARGIREILIKPPSSQQLAGLLQRVKQAGPTAPFTPRAELPPPAPSFSAALEIPQTAGFAPAVDALEPIPAAPLRSVASAGPRFSSTPPPPSPAIAAAVAAQPVPVPAPPIGGAAPESPGPIPNRVQTIRDPEDAIERAVMKTLREALPEGAFAAAVAQSVAPRAPVTLAAALAQTAPAAENSLAPRIEALRDQFQNRMQQVTRELVSQIGNLRTQLAQLEAAGSMARSGDDERVSLVQQSQFMLESRIERMASHFDGVLDTLRQDLETQHQAQGQRIERIGREARQAAMDEAHAVSERVVMNAAKRISDQVAESVLNVLKPVPTQHFR